MDEAEKEDVLSRRRRNLKLFPATSCGAPSTALNINLPDFVGLSVDELEKPNIRRSVSSSTPWRGLREARYYSPSFQSHCVALAMT
jgi:hypothetical protein